MNSPGKIGRLPRPLQKELNRRLLRGDSSTPILEWLNPLPEVQAILQADFAGTPINKQNLCDWRASGLVKWETRQEVLTEILDFDGDAGELDTATQGRLAERLATNLAGRYARLLHHWDGEVTDEFTKKIQGLRSLAQDVSHLRRWDHSAARVRLEQARLETSQEPDNEALFMKFEEWALNIGVQEYLTAYYESGRDREKARRKLLHLPPLPEDAAEPKSPVPGAPVCDPQHTAAPTASDHQPSSALPERPRPGGSNEISPASPGIVCPEPKAHRLGSRSSTPSPEANPTPKPLQTWANAPVCDPQHTAAPTSSDRQSAPRSSIPVNGGADRGAEAFHKNVPPSPVLAMRAMPDESPASRPAPRAPSLPPAVPSPCLGVCKRNGGGFCTGCFRNTVEKVRWPTMADVEKDFVVATCAKRKASQHPSRRTAPEGSPTTVTH